MLAAVPAKMAGQTPIFGMTIAPMIFAGIAHMIPTNPGIKPSSCVNFRWPSLDETRTVILHCRFSYRDGPHKENEVRLNDSAALV